MTEACYPNITPFLPPCDNSFYEIDEEDEAALNVIRSSISDLLTISNATSSSYDGADSSPLFNYNSSLFDVPIQSPIVQQSNLISIGPRCSRCGNPCGEDAIYQGNLAFHARHFTCRECGKALKVAISVNNEIYCQVCAKKVAPQSNCCYICNTPRSQSSIIAAGRCYCREHFRCATCNQILDIASFKQFNGHFYCEEHCPTDQLPICAGCNRQILSSKIICACSNNKFHQECFNCVKCQKNLVDQKYTVYNERPICVNCFKHLPKEVKTAIAKNPFRH
ncbi:hypothetical protein TRFO_33812 [Tritrichomonas foetus]|uniref:LIM zinc-binding domain-containing protein n=1 Tax=Tritrichomonas foetus TaxID=1144522 RepID=A0A1J4JQD8_9EUKA|nr:hypothetical protein TRFO_33812 [Tritrichomonas foetus]|eukprot:OHS99731.1 hypothetical protein TRFO_33812 [Tritrichomonas foetus]